MSYAHQISSANQTLPKAKDDLWQWGSMVMMVLTFCFNEINA